MIYLASDHAGFGLKLALINFLFNAGREYYELGCYSEESCDYSDFAHPLAEKVLADEGSIGVAICGTGIGMSMALNRHRGIRAALCSSTQNAVLARKHNDANVLVLPGRQIQLTNAIYILDFFLMTEFDGGRHQRRTEKIELPEPE